LLGKIEEDMAIKPPTKKTMPDSRSSIIEKESSCTNVKASTLRINDKNSNAKKSINKRMRLTFKTQLADRRQLNHNNHQQRGSWSYYFFTIPSKATPVLCLTRGLLEILSIPILSQTIKSRKQPFLQT
jgi:hypothetical protein